MRSLVDLHGRQVQVGSAGIDPVSHSQVRLSLHWQPRSRRRPWRTCRQPTRRVHSAIAGNSNGREQLVLIEEIGFSVRSASNGEATLKLASESSPSLVVLDISLPGINGYEVARRTRGPLGLPKIKIVGLTDGVMSKIGSAAGKLASTFTDEASGYR